MPFKKVGEDDYTSPSGRHFNAAQVRMYYATDGFKKKPRKPGHKRPTPKPIPAFGKGRD